MARQTSERVSVKARFRRLIVSASVKCLFFLAFSAAAGVVIAAAQETAVTNDQQAKIASNPTVNRKLQKKLHAMSKRYKLRPDQVQSILVIFLEEERQLSLLAGNHDLKPEERITQRRAVQDAARQRIAAVLDETQRSKYLKDLAEQQADDDTDDPEGPPPSPPGDGGGGGPPPPMM